MCGVYSRAFKLPDDGFDDMTPTTHTRPAPAVEYGDFTDASDDQAAAHPAAAASHETWRNAHRGTGRVRRRPSGAAAAQPRNPGTIAVAILVASALLGVLTAATSPQPAIQGAVLIVGGVGLSVAIHLFTRSRGLGGAYTVLGASYALVLCSVLAVLFGTSAEVFGCAVALGVSATVLVMSPDVPERLLTRVHRRRWISYRAMRRRSLPTAMAAASTQSPLSTMLIRTTPARSWSLERRLQRRVLAHTLRDGCRLCRCDSDEVLICAPATATQEAAFVARRIATVLPSSEIVATATTTDPRQDVIELIARLRQPEARDAAAIATLTEPPSRWLSFTDTSIGTETRPNPFVATAVLEASRIALPPPSWLGYGIRPRLAAHPALPSAPITDVTALSPSVGAIVAELIGTPIEMDQLRKHLPDQQGER